MSGAGATPLILEPLEDTPLGRFTIDPGEAVTIGREHDCRIRIDDEHVSKHHARLGWSDGAWSVVDLGSRNGTRINRWKLTPNDPVILHDGDALTVGRCHFQVRLGGGAGKLDSYVTRASIFLRLRDTRPRERDLAWSEFRGRYAPIIVGFSRNAGLPAQDADDVLQDVMMGFFRRAPDFEYDPGKGHFRAYLKRATLNAIRKRARAGAGRQVSAEYLDRQADAGEAEWEKHWADRILERALEEARRRFDEQTYEAFELYGRRGVPAEAVARQLGMSVNSVHQAKSRVLRVVAAVMERFRADEG